MQFHILCIFGQFQLLGYPVAHRLMLKLRTFESRCRSLGREPIRATVRSVISFCSCRSTRKYIKLFCCNTARSPLQKWWLVVSSRSPTPPFVPWCHNVWRRSSKVHTCVSKLFCVRVGESKLFPTSSVILHVSIHSLRYNPNYTYAVLLCYQTTEH